MLFSKEEFKNCIELREKFESAVEKVLVKKLNIEGKSLYTGEITSIELECERLEITVTEYSRCSCCSDTHHYYSFPESYLYTDRESGNQGIRESGNQGIRESGNQGIRESGNQGIRESRNQGIRESGNQGIRKK